MKRACIFLFHESACSLSYPHHVATAICASTTRYFLAGPHAEARPAPDLFPSLGSGAESRHRLLLSPLEIHWKFRPGVAGGQSARCSHEG